MSPGPLLDQRTLNRTLLARQLLLARVRRPVLEVVDHLVGMQAQLPTSSYVGLWSRIEAFDPEDLAALVLDRRAVRMVLMRGTIHLVSVDDALALRPVMQPVLEGQLARYRTWRDGLEGVDLAPVLALGRSLVEERPRSLAEIRTEMARRWPERDAAALAYAVRNLLPTIQVPPRGVWGRSGQAALTTLDHWSGRALGTDASPDATILRYLAAFGPASVADMTTWSGLTGLREVVERLRPQLATFRDERGRELLDVPGWLLADADLPAPVRFLPDYDNLLLSHADRARIIPESMRGAVLGRIGDAPFLLDGFVAGFWTLHRGGSRDRPAIVVEPLAALSRAERIGVEAEALALLGLLAPDGGDVRFVGPA